MGATNLQRRATLAVALHLAITPVILFIALENFLFNNI